MTSNSYIHNASMERPTNIKLRRQERMRAQFHDFEMVLREKDQEFNAYWAHIVQTVEPNVFEVEAEPPRPIAYTVARNRGSYSRPYAVLEHLSDGSRRCIGTFTHEAKASFTAREKNMVVRQ